MCGIAGFVAPASGAEDARQSIKAMLDVIAHRGPDDEGVWQESSVTLGHRRLAIVDLSPAGHQPMQSASGRYVIVFNGEIYNHAILKKDLVASGMNFRGNSDTEVLLALVEKHGLEMALKRCIGMFALALWDRSSQTLQLARDRFGEKPLYYGWQGSTFLFGSELNALRKHPAFEEEISSAAVQELLHYSYIGAPQSIFKGIYKLPQGSILTLPVVAGSVASRDVTPVPYWSHLGAVTEGMASPFSGSLNEAVDQVDSLLRDAVGLQMQADVPLGAFLSGGVDSSLIVALMQAQATRPVRTFAIGFDHPTLDEAPYARDVAAHLGTEHTEMYVSDQDALDIIPSLASICDEPFADSSQIPTYLVSRLARQSVTVSLSGDGGDEIFGGYTKYRFGNRWRSIPARPLLAMLVGALPWSLMGQLAKVGGARLSGKFSRARLENLHRLLSAPDGLPLADMICRTNLSAESLLREPVSEEEPKLAGSGVISEYFKLAMLWDRQRYLPDDILVKVDRASMAVSLESRAPFLDHRLVEFAARLPSSYLDDGSASKRVLRELLYRYVPRNLVDRPKAGFSIPLDEWLRGRLRDWATALIMDTRQDPVLDMAACRRMLTSHIAGKANHGKRLWPVLMYLAWRQE